LTNDGDWTVGSVWSPDVDGQHPAQALSLPVAFHQFTMEGSGSVNMEQPWSILLPCCTMIEDTAQSTIAEYNDTVSDAKASLLIARSDTSDNPSLSVKFDFRPCELVL
jgi:hypothetical protein